MTCSTQTNIHYIIPEDDDDLNYPNIFILHKPIEEIYVRDIRENFPLPGNFHFRFMQAFDKSYVWMDIEDNSIAPQYQNHIIAKVSRISVPEAIQPQEVKNQSVGLDHKQKEQETLPKQTEAQSKTETISRDPSPVENLMNIIEIDEYSPSTPPPTQVCPKSSPSSSPINGDLLFDLNELDFSHDKIPQAMPAPVVFQINQQFPEGLPNYAMGSSTTNQGTSMNTRASHARHGSLLKDPSNKSSPRQAVPRHSQPVNSVEGMWENFNLGGGFSMSKE